MGLDISAYRKLRPVECGCEDGDCGESDHVRVFQDPAFAGHEAPLALGRCYATASEVLYVHAGPYSAYNRWREGLSMLALEVMPRRVWDHPERYEGRPFVELIHFSDCEGTIGPEVAARLARDFAEWDERAERAMDERDYRKYGEWRAAFEMAADEGAVCFH